MTTRLARGTEFRAGKLGLLWDEQINGTKDAVAWLLSQGVEAVDRIAFVVGVSEQGVRYHLRNLGFYEPKSPSAFAARDAAIGRYLEFKSPAEIADMTGLSRPRISQIARRLRREQAKWELRQKIIDAQAGIDLELLAQSPLCRLAIERLARRL